MLAARESAGRQDVIVGLLLVGVTLAGVIGFANVFSFLMMLCLGLPGLLLLLDSLADDASAQGGGD